MWFRFRKLGLAMFLSHYNKFWLTLAADTCLINIQLKMETAFLEYRTMMRSSEYKQSRRFNSCSTNTYKIYKERSKKKK